MNTHFRTHDFGHRAAHHNDRDFYQSPSMFPPMNYGRLSPYSRFPINNDNEYFRNNRMNLPHTFQQMSLRADESDDDDDEDQTPTVEHPSPKYPQ